MREICGSVKIQNRYTAKSGKVSSYLVFVNKIFLLEKRVNIIFEHFSHQLNIISLYR